MMEVEKARRRKTSAWKHERLIGFLEPEVVRDVVSLTVKNLILWRFLFCVFKNFKNFLFHQKRCFKKIITKKSPQKQNFPQSQLMMRELLEGSKVEFNQW